MNTSFADNKLLTVMVAAYNIERFVEQSLDSVFSQPGSISHVSMVVVIDGATDNTENLVRRFAANHVDCDISILVQANGGLSSARNEGLRHVTTEYVTFLDGDDFWLPDYLEHVLPEINGARHDIIEYDAWLTDELGRPYKSRVISAGPTGRPTKVTKFDFIKVFRAYSWARVFRTELVKSKPFPVGLRYEDAHTTPWYYNEAESILSLGRPLLAYRQRRQSIVCTPRIEDIVSLNLCAREAWNSYKSSGDPYWSTITMRVLQVACTLIIEMPFRTWYKAIALSRRELADEIDPGHSLVRILQVRWTWIYLILLYVKRTLVNKKLTHIRKLAASRKSS